MSIRLVKNKKIWFLSALCLINLFAVVRSQNQALVVKKYDTILTSIYLMSNLLPYYDSLINGVKEENSLEVIFLQNVNNPDIKSLKLDQSKSGIRISIVSKDFNHVEKASENTLSKIDSLTKKIDENVELIDNTANRIADYFTFFIIRRGTKIYQIKIPNYVFFSHYNNLFVEYVKEFLNILGLDYSQIIREYIDG